MTHIRDLTPYDYYPGAPEAFAVGWLDISEPFTTGRCPGDVRRRLAQLANHPVRLMRGYHYCQFCKAEPLQPLREDRRLYEAPDVPRGSGEIWLTSPDGLNFAAPVLIAHYVDAHEYMPPNVFIEAIRRGTPTSNLT